MLDCNGFVSRESVLWRCKATVCSKQYFTLRLSNRVSDYIGCVVTQNVSYY